MLVLAPMGEDLTKPNLLPQSFKNFQYHFIFGNAIWLTIIGLFIFYSAVSLKINRVYFGVIGWLLSLQFFIRESGINRGTPILAIGNPWVRSFYIITTLGAIGSILAGIFAKSSEERGQKISRGFWLGIGFGIGVSVLITLITYLPQ
jgi:hypothetical protein